MKVSDIIYEVSRDLNDQEQGYEYTTWSREQLRSYLYESITQLAFLFHKLFITRRVVRVQAGGLWQRVCDCEQILRVVGEVTEDGEQLIRNLSVVLDDPRLTWAGDVARCPVIASGAYEITGYSISDTDESMLKVYPSIPRGEPDHYVLVECFNSPRAVPDNFDVPDRIVALVKQWMLYRAYSVDSENNTAVVQLASQHMATYTALFQTQTALLAQEEARHDSLRAVPNDTNNRAT